MATVISLLNNNCEKDDDKEETKKAIAEYVTLGVSSNQPSFTFPKESGEGYWSSIYTNIQYNNLSQILSYSLKVTCPSDNVYNILVSNIQRNSSGTPTSYKADITAIYNGQTISGILYYP